MDEHIGSVWQKCNEFLQYRKKIKVGYPAHHFNIMTIPEKVLTYDPIFYSMCKKRSNEWMNTLDVNTERKNWAWRKHIDDCTHLNDRPWVTKVARGFLLS